MLWVLLSLTCLSVDGVCVGGRGGGEGGEEEEGEGEWGRSFRLCQQIPLSCDSGCYCLFK